MSWRTAFRLACPLLLTVGSLPLFAQQFSAVLVHQKPEGAVPAKVSVNGDKVRLELDKGRRGGIVVIDLKEQTGFIALPEGKSYTVLPPERISTPMPFFHAADPENACPAWEKLVNKPGSCTKVGDVVLNGRAAVKYAGAAQNGETGSAWVDRKLNFVVKWEGQARAAEIRNIQEAPQSLSLFEIPKGYDKVDPRAAQQAPGSGKTKPQVQKPLK